MKQTWSATGILLVISLSIHAQTTSANHKLPEDLLHFFIGNWSGEGAFANGRKIAADVSFKLALDSSWLTYEHTDQLPGSYKAFSMWGVDRQSGQFMAYTFDNFGGHRQFVSGGWKDGKIRLTDSEFYPGAGLIFEHFIFERLTEKSFKMTYETSNDSFRWSLGDSLVFTRQ